MQRDPHTTIRKGLSFVGSMSKDTRPYFVLTNEYPRHRKIRGLSDRAFRLHVTLFGLCNEEKNDGHIQRVDLEMLGKKAGKELLDAGLVREDADSGYRLHDYTRHQNTAEEIAQKQKDKQERGARGGRRSAHTRWHTGRGEFDPNCEYCNDLTG